MTSTKNANIAGRRLNVASLSGEVFCFGRFEVGEALGGDPFFYLYNAWDRRRNDSVGLRVSVERLTSRRGQVKSVTDILQSVSRLRHPNVVKIREFFQEGADLVIVPRTHPRPFRLRSGRKVEANVFFPAKRHLHWQRSFAMR